MTHVGFGRPNHQRALAVFAEDVSDCVDLLGVTSLGARPMGLYVGHRSWVNASLGIDLLQQLLLNLSRWEGDTCPQYNQLAHSQPAALINSKVNSDSPQTLLAVKILKIMHTKIL